MDGAAKTIISASRRTDIPAFYLDWFLARLGQGSFVVENPFNGARRRLSTHPQQVQAIVFWSKDYARLLARAAELARYRLFFNFTLNSESALLEPRVPPLSERLRQLRELSRRFGAAAIQWRFDPIVCWEEDGERRNNLGQFDRILEAASGAAVGRLVLSFMDHYPKIGRRLRHLPGVRLREPGLEEMVELATPLALKARQAGLKVAACCEKELVGALPPGLIEPSRCIDAELLASLYGPGASLIPDRGQRRAAGCGCHLSVDVGSYCAHPCAHNCLYCYASPAEKALPLAAHGF